MRAFISCMVACSLPTNDWVPSQNVEGSWWSQAQLKQKQEGKQQYCSDEKTRDACTFLHAIWSCVRVDQATIPHLKEDIQGYLLIIDQDCSLTDRYFLNVFLSRAWVYHACSWFCAANQLFPIADLTIIPHMKAHILLFKWTPIASIFVYKKGLFKANGPFKCLSPRIILKLSPGFETSWSWFRTDVGRLDRN